eukprot:gene43641-59102_t
MAQFDIKGMGFQSAAAIHHGVEAKRLAFEDRARFYADPAFYNAPIDWLLSSDYARERAALIRPDHIAPRVYYGKAPGHGDTTYLTTADADGMRVGLNQRHPHAVGVGAGEAAEVREVAAGLGVDGGAPVGGELHERAEDQGGKIEAGFAVGFAELRGGLEERNLDVAAEGVEGVGGDVCGGGRMSIAALRLASYPSP